MEQLPGLFEIEEPSDDGEDEDGERRDDDNEEVGRPQDDDEDYFSNAITSESEVRARIINSARQQAPKLEKRKRDMARRQLHERWRRRQFYLDEEEGGVAPGEWEDDEDVLMHLHETGESSKSAEEAADDPDDYDLPSNASIPSSQSDPEQWEGWGLPDAERDAGKEILYQVTQQAFNELLDTIFKPAEDMAVQAAETKAQREMHRDLIEKVNLEDDEQKDPKLSNTSVDDPVSSKVQSPGDKSLEELLSETGYTIEPPEGRNAIEIETTEEIIYDEKVAEDPVDEQEDASKEYQDPTLPQFRPDNPTGFDDGSYLWYPVTDARRANLAKKAAKKPFEEPEGEPSEVTLQHWKRLGAAEAQAARRGGWGKLNFEEFEAIYKSQEHQGNRLDYLGSWIDFCIP